MNIFYRVQTASHAMALRIKGLQVLITFESLRYMSTIFRRNESVSNLATSLLLKGFFPAIMAAVCKLVPVRS